MTILEAVLEPRLLTAVILVALSIGCAAVVAAAKTLPRLAVVSILASVLALGGTFGLHAALPSRAKLITLEAARTPTAEVLWFAVIPSQSLELLLQWPGSGGPRLYWVAWTQDLADALQQASTAAKTRGTPLMVKNPFSGLSAGGKKGGQGQGQGEGSGNGSGDGQEGHEGHGQGGGPRTGDNDGPGESPFYPSPPPSLPEKEGFGE